MSRKASMMAMWEPIRCSYTQARLGPKTIVVKYAKLRLVMDKPPSPVTRKLYAAAGWSCVGLAAVGAALPVMPTTVFLIVAFACFSKSSPDAARKLLDHPRFGRPLRAWQDNGAISVDSKKVAVAAMAISWGLTLAFSDGWMVPAGVGAILAAVAVFIVTRPLPPEDAA